MRDVGNGEADTGPQGKGGRGEGDGGEMTIHVDCSSLSCSWFSGGGGGASSMVVGLRAATRDRAPDDVDGALCETLAVARRDMGGGEAACEAGTEP